MDLITKEIKPDCNIFLFGDDHNGLRLSDDDGFAAMVDMIHSPYDDVKNNYWVHHGDTVEGRTPDHKFFDISATRQSLITKQRDMAIKKLSPIKEQGICLLQGNHEFGLQKFGNISQDISKALDLPLTSDDSPSAMAVIRYTNNGKLVLKHFAGHGWGTMNMQAGDKEQRKANKIIKLKRALRYKAADCFLMSMGHTHQLLTRKPLLELNMTSTEKKLHQIYDELPKKFSDGMILHEDLRWYVNTGCFLKTLGIGFGSYSERLGMDPNELGFAVALIRDFRLVNVREEKI